MEPESTLIFTDPYEHPIIYASTGQRFLNYLIDGVILYGLNYCLGTLYGYIITSSDFLLEIAQRSTTSYVLLIMILGVFVRVGYYTLMEGLCGKTIGKFATRTIVKREDGAPIVWKDAILRSLCRLIPFNGLSGLSGHPWHDSITKTVVVQQS